MQEDFNNLKRTTRIELYISEGYIANEREAVLGAMQMRNDKLLLGEQTKKAVEYIRNLENKVVRRFFTLIFRGDKIKSIDGNEFQSGNCTM